MLGQDNASSKQQQTEPTPTTLADVGEVFVVFLRLGFTSFGGPIAHIGFFRDEFVSRRNWLEESNFADLVALCQFLPGPASSQVGLAIGLMRAGLLGAIAAWIAFTLPSAAVMTLFAYSILSFGDLVNNAWIHGLKIAAVAVVAHALLGMAQSLAPDKERATLAVFAAAIALMLPSTLGQVLAICIGGVVGLTLLAKPGHPTNLISTASTISKPVAIAALGTFFLLLFTLPLLVTLTSDPSIALFEAFYRTGALVFGGGHVVLPLLQSEVVQSNLVSNDQFIAGYGAAQAIPGPLFTFASYLGSVIGGWPTALLCTIAVFLPSFLLVIGVLPFWDDLRRNTWMQSCLRGVNAAVVGLLLAALYTPVWTTGVTSARDFAIAAFAFLLLTVWRLPSWLAVLLAALASGFSAMIAPSLF